MVQPKVNSSGQPRLISFPLGRLLLTSEAFLKTMHIVASLLSEACAYGGPVNESVIESCLFISRILKMKIITLHSTNHQEHGQETLSLKRIVRIPLVK